MSVQWGFFCETCQEQSDTPCDHAEDKLRQVIMVIPLVVALLEHPTLAFEIRITGLYRVEELWGFLCEHGTHKLSLINEYGETHKLLPINEYNR